MNNLNKIQKGFAHMATIMLIIVLAVVVGAGWMVYSRQKDKDAKTTQSTSTPATTEQGTVTKSSDVDSSIKELDASNVDSDLNTSEVDADLNAVL